jgi:hypothetical protein
MIETVIIKCWFSLAMLTSPLSLEKPKQPFEPSVRDNCQLPTQRTAMSHKKELGELKNTSLAMLNKQIDRNRFSPITKVNTRINVIRAG